VTGAPAERRRVRGEPKVNSLPSGVDLAFLSTEGNLLALNEIME